MCDTIAEKDCFYSIFFFSHRSFFLFFNLWNDVILLFVEENVGHARHLLFVNRSLEREKL